VAGEHFRSRRPHVTHCVTKWSEGSEARQPAKLSFRLISCKQFPLTRNEPHSFSNIFADASPEGKCFSSLLLPSSVSELMKCRMNFHEDCGQWSRRQKRSHSGDREPCIERIALPTNIGGKFLRTLYRSRPCEKHGANKQHPNGGGMANRQKPKAFRLSNQQELAHETEAIIEETE
jgi:hypothetical protein